MRKKILVTELIEEGNVLIQTLKRKRFPITAAGWYDLPDAEWRLCIVSSSVDRKGPLSAYTVVQQVLKSLPAGKLTLSDVTLISPTGNDFQNLRSLLSIPGPSRDLVLEDAYVYSL